MEQKTVNEKIAKEMISFLKRRKLWVDSAIYVNGTRIHSDGRVEENIDVTKYLEFCNPDGVSMIFEGPLNRHINGHISGSNVYKKLDEIANKYGFYIEQGYSWSISLYK